MSEDIIRDLKMGHDDLSKRVTKIEIVDIPALKVKQESECEAIKKEMIEHSKRQDDATNNNTLALLSLTESITQNTVVYAGLIERLDKMEPVVDRSRDVISWWDEFVKWIKINHKIAKYVGGAILTLILTLGALAAALKQLGWW